jgi:hypothetical protein
MNKVINGRNQIKRLFQLRARIKRLEEIEEGMTKDALTHLKTYGTLKQDEWAAMVSVTETRRPKWKEEYVKECGAEKAAEVTSNTKPSISEKVEIYREGIKVNA